MTTTTTPEKWRSAFGSHFIDVYGPHAYYDKKLEDFIHKNFISRSEIQKVVEKVEGMKRTDETHLSADHVYDEALDSVLSLLKEVIEKKV